MLRLTRLKVRCAAAHTAMPAPRKIDIRVAAPSAVLVIDSVVSGVGVLRDDQEVVFVATGTGTGGGDHCGFCDGAKILPSGDRRYSTGVAHSRSLTSE